MSTGVRMSRALAGGRARVVTATASRTVPRRDRRALQGTRRTSRARVAKIIARVPVGVQVEVVGVRTVDAVYILVRPEVGAVRGLSASAR